MENKKSKAKYRLILGGAINLEYSEETGLSCKVVGLDDLVSNKKEPAPVVVDENVRLLECNSVAFSERQKASLYNAKCLIYPSAALSDILKGKHANMYA